jgi:hypothetical protein
MQLPIEVGKITQVVTSARRTYAKPPRAFETAFRVSKKEHADFLTVPKMDDKADIVLKKLGAPNKDPLYSRAWENELSTIDRFMRSITRLSAFQLSVLNASMVELQPVQDQTSNNTDFAIPATALATDISAQMMKLSIGVSHRITRLRRQNACLCIKKKNIDMFADDLLEVPFDKDPSLLFGGQFDKISKNAAKKEEAARATRRSQSSGRSSGSRKSGYYNSGKGTYQQSGSKQSYDRGSKRKADNQGSYAPASKRG